MTKSKRTLKDKWNTLLHGQDLRITQGDAYTDVREFDFSSYYPEENYIEKNQPIPEDNIYDIRDFGAVAGDTSVDNALMINKAFEAAERTGGTVLIAGGDYTTTTVFLKSGVTLFIEYNSALVAHESGQGFTHRALIYGENLDSVILTGGGKLKGNGHLFGRKPYFDENVTRADEYIDVIEMRRSYRAQLRFAHESKYGGLINLASCTNVMMHNFILENSAYWTLRLQTCTNVDIHNFMINNNRNVANSDGFDIVGGRRINIRHCFVSTADDGIVLKNAIWLGSNEVMEDISVSDCEVISRTNSFKIGTETTCDIRRINVDNCSFFMTDVYPGAVSGISIESSDGSKVYDIHIKNIVMDRCTCPIFVRLNNRNRAVEAADFEQAQKIEFGVTSGKKSKVANKISPRVFHRKGEVRDIIFENITAKDVEIPIIIAGYRQNGFVNYVENVALKNIHLSYAKRKETLDRRLFIPEYAKEYPESWRFRNLPAYGIWARHAKKLMVDNFDCFHEASWKKETILKDCPQYNM